MTSTTLTQEIPTADEVLRLFQEAVRLQEPAMLRDFDGVEGWEGSHWQIIQHLPSGTMYKLRFRSEQDVSEAPISVQCGHLEWVGHGL